MEIEFEVGEKKFRFRKLDKSNMIIEEQRAKEGGTLFWKRVSGFHRPHTIHRELVELVGEEIEAVDRLEGYYQEIVAGLLRIEQRLDTPFRQD